MPDTPASEGADQFRVEPFCSPIQHKLDDVIAMYRSHMLDVWTELGMPLHEAQAAFEQMVAPARSELRRLRERAEAQGDAELLVRNAVQRPDAAHFFVPLDDNSRWVLRVRDGEQLDTGPIVNGLPILTSKAREAMREAVECG